jgi:type VI secretion system protein ImpJ
MAWYGKVVWSEGLFLRPQHFQQQERYLEFFANARAAALEPHFWGFRDLAIDVDALALGRIALASAEGVMPDGTPFHVPAQGPAPEPLEVAASVKDETIVLALPMRRQQTEEVSFTGEEQSLARYRVSEAEVPDSNSMGGAPAAMQLGDLRLRLVPASSVTAGWLTLGVARVVERRADNALVLDRAYIPPTLAVGRQPVLASFLTELQGLLHLRGEALSARVAQAGRGGISEVGDFLLLGVTNRWEPVIQHWTETGVMHPERVYAGLLQLAGELATYTRETRRPQAYPRYDHDDLQGCFRPLIADLRRSLSMVLEQNAIPIELQDRNYGVRVAVMPSVELLRSAAFVLAVHADIPGELVRTRLPQQVKIGPVERIRDLVNLHLPGVGLTALPVAPRQLPYNAGYSYFELDTSSELWRQLERSGGLAMHIAGEFPGLRLEFWAIRR